MEKSTDSLGWGAGGGKEAAAAMIFMYIQILLCKKISCKMPEDMYIAEKKDDDDDDERRL